MLCLSSTASRSGAGGNWDGKSLRRRSLNNTTGKGERRAMSDDLYQSCDVSSIPTVACCWRLSVLERRTLTTFVFSIFSTVKKAKTTLGCRWLRPMPRRRVYIINEYNTDKNDIKINSFF